MFRRRFRSRYWRRDDSRKG